MKQKIHFITTGFFLLMLFGCQTEEQEKINILWLIIEDFSPDQEQVETYQYQKTKPSDRNSFDR
ncbi:MAG: hypothetical protein ACI9A7_000774 [Cyclobacteriaceae bacterium]|jgi:hypothetical protein